MLKHLAAAASGDEWIPSWDANGERVVEVRLRGGGRGTIRVKRDLDPARIEDVEFIAQSRADIVALVNAFQSGEGLDGEELDAMEERYSKAAPAPWRAFVQTDGGLGGTNVIQVKGPDDAPDIYLWLDGEIAPPEDYEFVAAARNAIPIMISAMRKS